MTKGRATAVCLVALTAALTGCSSSSANSAGTSAASTTTTTPASPSTSSSTAVPPVTSSSVSPSSSSSTTTSLPPLSPYEKLPQVIGLRAYAREYAKAVNKGNMSYPPFRATVGPKLNTPANLNWMAGTDLKKKLHYPGPLPLTPTRVSGNTVFACVWAEGFATDRKTGVAPEARKIYPVQFSMGKSSAGNYVVDMYGDAQGLDCTKHKVIGRSW